MKLSPKLTWIVYLRSKETLQHAGIHENKDFITLKINTYFNIIYWLSIQYIDRIWCPSIKEESQPYPSPESYENITDQEDDKKIGKVDVFSVKKLKFI